jgi:hypothetical protein
MRRVLLLLVLAALALSGFAVHAGDTKAAKTGKPEWHMNATIIEACSCPMFCQCYFATKPAAHGSSVSHGDHSHDAKTEHFCRANNVFRVNKGTYKGVKLDGARFWLAMDLGDDFSDGTMKWCIATFDPSVTKEQREGIATILSHLYPVKWEEPLQVAADLPIEWKFEGDRAVARLDGGKAGEVQLNGGSVLRNGGELAVIKNLRYWGAPRHDGFVLMPNDVEAYRLGPKAFEFKGTNGFMITFDIDSNTAPPAAGS